MQETIKYILNPDYELKKLQDQYVLVEKNKNNTNPDLILLNSTGQVIIQNLTSEKDLHELVNMLSEIFNMKTEMLLEDISSFINRLVSKDIIIITNKQ